MAEVMETNIAAAEEIEAAAAPERIPIEERTDVTVDEIERTSLPFDAELYDGKIVYKMATFEHGLIQAQLIGLLSGYETERPKIGYFLPEVSYQLSPERPRECRIPDISFVKRERLPADLHKFPRMAPDLAIEIISCDDKVLHIFSKVDEYLKHGVQIVWLVIPVIREVWICTKEQKYSVRDVLTAPELLPGFELLVEKIFENLPAPVKSE